jgi:pyrroline-5-carboxylate reductase
MSKQVGLEIAFIGGGNMGEAMLAAVLSRGLSTSASITVSDISEARRQYLAEKYKVGVTSDSVAAIKRAQVVVLAIKPQSLAAAMVGMKGHFKPEQLIVSIIAGAKIETLGRGLNHEAIARVMPNTPAQIGEGMSVWTATPAVTAAQKKFASAILGVTGKEIYVDDEKYLDMVTAVSGSGPAYVFLFMEALIDAAVSIGLSPQMAQTLVMQTVKGSADYADKSGKALPELRRMVTSPGGTTAAALARFEQGAFNRLVKEAVTAAYNRAKELGG